MAMAPPGKFDVVCGRGRTAYMHSGNERFREIIADNIETYAKAVTRLDKSIVVSAICSTVREKGDFYRQNLTSTGSEWEKVTERMAREKCGQGLRDFLHTKYRSSTQAKQTKRKHDLKEESVLMRDFIDSNVQIRSVFGQLKSDLSSSSGGDVSDGTVEQMFTSANLKILEELKLVSSSLGVLPHASPPSSPRRRLSSKVAGVLVHGEEETTDIPELTSSDFDGLFACV